MLAFHGNIEIKNRFLERIRMHRLADEITQGQYWENGRGCAVGCTIHGDDHRKYETELGIPREVAYIEDGLFEGLTFVNAKRWPERFLSTIPVGADLSKIPYQFYQVLLCDPKWGMQINASSKEQHYITKLYNAIQRQIEGSPISSIEYQNFFSDEYLNKGFWRIAEHTRNEFIGVDMVDINTLFDVCQEAFSSAVPFYYDLSEKLLKLLAAAPIPYKE